MTRGELKDEIKSIISECMLEMNNNSDDSDNTSINSITQNNDDELDEIEDLANE